MKNIFTVYGLTHETARCRAIFERQKPGEVTRLTNQSITETEAMSFIQRDKLTLMKWQSETQSKFLCESQKFFYVADLSHIILRVVPVGSKNVRFLAI